MKIKILIIVFLTSLSLLCCKQMHKSDEMRKSSDFETYKEDDYIKVQGIVLKKIVRFKKSLFNSNEKGDIYYIYDLDLTKPQIGVERKSNLMFNEDDLVTVMVNKKDSAISFIGHRGIVDSELLYQYLSRSDSSYYRMKNKVPFDYK